MKKYLALIMSVLLGISCIFPVNATYITMEQENSTYLNASVNLLDLAKWADIDKYKNATVLKSTDNDINNTDIINVSSDTIEKIDLNKVLQIVDNGALLIVQNKSNINSSTEMAKKINISVQSIVSNVDDEMTSIVLGYCIRKGWDDYIIEPILATVMKPINDTGFDLSEELNNLKNADNVYIDPIEFYCQAINSPKFFRSILDIKEFAAGTQKVRKKQAHTETFGWAYLYGKNGNAVWGTGHNGYTLFGYIENSIYVIREFTKNGYNYDAVECQFTATGRGNKYVKSYSTFNQVVSNSLMDAYTYLNVKNKYIYSTSYSWSGNGTTSSVTVQSEVNPGEQQISTSKTYNHVLWKCVPNSHLKNASWFLEAGCSTKTAIGKRATIRVGFDELVVDNAFLKYTSPCPVCVNITYNK